MVCPGGGNEARQVVFHMSTRAEEQGHYADRRRAGGRERRHGFAERGTHHLEIRQPDEKFLRKLRRDAFERPRPFRIARPMGEKNNSSLQCSVARRPS